MDIIKRGETGVVTARRKKRVKEERKSIFEKDRALAEKRKQEAKEREIQ